MGVEAFDGQREPELASKTPKCINFEGVKVQWGKGEWEFNHLTLGLGKIVKPTYSIYNPAHRSEIVDRLSAGETAAGMMMGNFGLLKILNASGSADALFEVKQRPKDQNFVALVHPENIIDILDMDRLFQKPYRIEFLMSDKRSKLYAAGPQHIIVPVKTSTVNEAFIHKDDQTMSCFWIPDHFGFEGLINEMKRKNVKGFIGGSSLNIHGKPPFYTKESLCREMAQQESWLKEIDFIVFDDIVEAANIGRSQTMIRYVDDNPEIFRVGSVSVNRMWEKSKYEILLSKDMKFASSKTVYNRENDVATDEKVIQVLQRIQRFSLSLYPKPDLVDRKFLL